MLKFNYRTAVGMYSVRVCRIMSLLLCFAFFVSFLAVAKVTAAERIIITTQDSGYSEEGIWTDSDVVGYNGLMSRYGTAQSNATFTPNLPNEGYYKVSFYKVISVTQSDERGRVDVIHGEGSDSKFFDFTSGKSDWEDIGVFYFEAGQKGSVKVYAAEHGRASAARFEAVAETDAEDFQPVFTDIDDSPYKRAITVLGGLGLFSGYSDGTFRPEGEITRGEFAVIVSRIMNGDQVADMFRDDSSFSDVNGGYFGAAEVNFAASMGIINGYGNGAFGPNDFLTYEQAVKIIVNLLGYGVQAESQGGYPIGYMTTAGSTGIVRGAGGQMGQAVTRGTVARMVFNALEIPLMDGAVYSGKEIIYNIDNSVTLLSKYLKMIRIEGHLFANTNTTMVDNSKAPKGMVEINNMLFDIGETDAEDYIGYYVTAYAEETGTDWKLVFLFLNESQNERLIVKADDIVEGTTRRELVYYSGDRIRTANISPIARMIYNGVALPAYEDVHLMPQSGRVELVRSGNSGEYDVIIVTSYITYVINGVSQETEQIFDKYLLHLDLDKSNIKYSITKGDEKIGLEQLNEWDVVYVAASREIINSDGTRTPDFDRATLYEMKVSSEKFDGTISEIREDGDSTRFVIIGKEYKVAPNLMSAFETRRATYPSVGDSGTFYVDAEGRIAALNISSIGSMQYGFVLAAGVVQGIGGEAEVKILTQKDEKVVTLRTRSMIDFNHVIERTPVTEKIAAKDLAGRFNVTEGGITRFDSQLIAYQVDGESKIKNIYKAFDARNESVASNEDYPLILGYSLDDSEVHDNKFNMTFSVSGSTLAFKIPNRERINDGKAGDWEYEIVPHSDVQGGDTTVIAYNLTEVNRARIVVYYDRYSGTSVSNWTLMTMIDRVTDASNREGERTKKIHGYSDGKKVEAAFSDHDIYADNTAIPAGGLQRGDAVKIEVNGDGEITALQVVRTAKQMYTDYRYNYGNDIGNERRFVSGTPTAKDGSSLKLELTAPYERQGSADKSDLIEIVTGLEDKAVMIYDAIKDDVYVGKLGDIIDERMRTNIGGDFISKCLLQTTWARPQSLFYYRLPTLE